MRERVTMAEVALAVALVVAVALAMSGCATLRPGGSMATFPRQDEAVRIVWRDVYGRTDAPPRIEWVHVEPGQGCAQASDDLGFRTVTGECVGGVTYDDKTVSSIEPLGRAFSETAMAHEMLHVAWFRLGKPAPHHAEWIAEVCRGDVTDKLYCVPLARQTEFYATVARANAALGRVGL